MVPGTTSQSGSSFWATHRVLGAEPLTPSDFITTVTTLPTFFVAVEASREWHPVVHRTGAGHVEVRHAPRRALLLERCPRLLSSLTSHISTADLTHAGVCAAARSEPASTSPAHGHRSGGPRPQLRRRRHVLGRLRPRRRAISHARMPISHPRSHPDARGAAESRRPRGKVGRASHVLPVDINIVEGAPTLSIHFYEPRASFLVRIFDKSIIKRGRFKFSMRGSRSRVSSQSL